MELAPPGAVLPPVARTRANVALPPLPGGAGDSEVVRGPGIFAPPERVREAARRVLDSFGPAPGHVFNLGHGLQPGTPVESVAALVDEVRAYSRRQRAENPAKP